MGQHFLIITSDYSKLLGVSQKFSSILVHTSLQCVYYMTKAGQAVEKYLPWLVVL